MLRQVLPAALYDNNPLQDAFTVQDAELGASRSTRRARTAG